MALHPYLIEFPGGPLFGVTAESEADALDLVSGEVFHHQTIPGEPVIRRLKPIWRLKVKGTVVARKAWKARGIWYPESYRPAVKK